MALTSDSKLFFLIESCLYSILEKNKLKSLSLETSFEDDKVIYETLELIRDEIRQLERQQQSLEEDENMFVKISTPILKNKVYRDAERQRRLLNQSARLLQKAGGVAGIRRSGRV